MNPATFQTQAVTTTPPPAASNERSVVLAKPSRVGNDAIAQAIRHIDTDSTAMLEVLRSRDPNILNHDNLDIVSKAITMQRMLHIQMEGSGAVLNAKVAQIRDNGPIQGDRERLESLAIPQYQRYATAHEISEEVYNILHPAINQDQSADLRIRAQELFDQNNSVMKDIETTHAEFQALEKEYREILAILPLTKNEEASSSKAVSHPKIEKNSDLISMVTKYFAKALQRLVSDILKKSDFLRTATESLLSMLEESSRLKKAIR